MKTYKTKDIRNIALLGHGGCGKTLLAEAMALKAGLIERLGSPEEGTTISDYDKCEQAKGSSISTALIPIEHGGVKINVLDIPGYFDYIGEQCSALRVADTVVIVVDSVSGVQVGTEKAYEMATKRGIPVAFLINKLDRENVDTHEVMEQLRALTGPKIVPFQIPINEGVGFNSVADIFDNKAYTYEKGKITITEVPDKTIEKSSKYKDIIFEIAATTDDELMEKYFEDEDGTLTEAELHTGVKTAIAREELIPVFCVSALHDIAIDKFLDAIVYNFPTPIEAKAAKIDQDGKQAQRHYCDDEPLSLFVFKTIADPFVGKLSLFKIKSGVLKPGIELLNTVQEKKEKIAKIYTLIGKKQDEVHEMYPGDIGAFAKLAYTKTSDTLCDVKDNIKFNPITFPQSIIFTGIEPKSRNDEDKLSASLTKLREEDPTIVVKRNDETNQNVLYGMGETHLEVVKDKLKNKYSIDVVLTDPIIPYRETIKKKATAEGKHKKQSGGRGQYGVVNIDFEPNNTMDEGLEFVDNVVGGAVPRNFIPAVEKGLNECIKEGPLAGYPVVGLRARLFDGKFHPVDSDEMSFKMAANLAYREGMAKANPVLLEPIYKVVITVPNDNAGDIMGDLNKKRGKVLDMDSLENKTQITADVPFGEMFKYATELRSMTQARGSFTMEFERYEEVPAHASEAIIEQAKKRKEASKK